MVRELDSRLDQLVTLVRELFKSGPVVLILDDLHWADVATIEILLALALKVEGPLMLVLAYRSDDLRPSPSGEPHPLMRAIFRMRRYKPSCRELDLEPLSQEDTVRLVRAAASVGCRIEDATVKRLARESAGVPLFAESLGEIYSRGAGENSLDGKFRQIASVVEERLSYASSDDQRMLEAALAIGFTFEVDFLAELLRVDVDSVYDRLDLLMREHHLIVEAEPAGSLDRYSLAHPLLAQVLKSRIEDNTTRWRRYQRRLVDIFLAQMQSDEFAVRAAVAATAANDPRAALLNLDAAQRQYEAGAVIRGRELATTAWNQAKDCGASASVFFDASDLLAQCLSAEANHREAAVVCARALEASAGIEVERVRKLRLLHARSLRMINFWDAASQILDELIGDHSDSVGRITADIMLLRAEIALCGPNQDTPLCIALCDSVARLSDDVELLYRAYGHRGLAHLAAYRPGESEAWLQMAIGIARSHGHPYGAYETLHWLSKKKIACMELDDAQSALAELANMSENSGVAQDSPFHRRDASRVLALIGDSKGAAEEFIEYFDDLDVHLDQDRALTVLVCQVAELDSLFSRQRGDSFLHEVGTVEHVGADPTESRGRLMTAVADLRQRPETLQAVEFAIEVVGVHPNEAHAAEAIFRFDVPDLAELRRLVTNG